MIRNIAPEYSEYDLEYCCEKILTGQELAEQRERIIENDRYYGHVSFIHYPILLEKTYKLYYLNEDITMLSSMYSEVAIETLD